MGFDLNISQMMKVITAMANKMMSSLFNKGVCKKLRHMLSSALGISIIKNKTIISKTKIPARVSINYTVRIYKYKGEVKDIFSTLSKRSESNGSTGFRNMWL